MSDDIDRAIAATDAKEPDSLIGDFTFNDGTVMKLVVPKDFNADQFETAVGILMQMRLIADERKKARNPIVVPNTPRLVRPDGRALS